MVIKSAEFVKSVSNFNDIYKSDYKEIAFVGRSNVGKSSLINFITNNSKLAKTSSLPGRTRLINYFLINKEFLLVDLPGYGYAKASKEAQGVGDPAFSAWFSNMAFAFNCSICNNSCRLHCSMVCCHYIMVNRSIFCIVFTWRNRIGGDFRISREWAYGIGNA